jgi:hypothetical protein
MGKGSLSPGVKRQGREAEHSRPTRADVNKLWIYTSTPPYACTATTLPFNPLFNFVINETLICYPAKTESMKFYTSELVLTSKNVDPLQPIGLYCSIN